MGLTTSPSLLARARDPRDSDAWDQLYRFYAPLIVGFSRTKGCTHDMALDVLQESMVELMKILPRFSYDPAKGQFRSFLLRVVEGRIKDAFKREKWYCSLESDSRHPWARELPDPAVEEPGKAWDELWEQNLLLQALERVESRIEPLTYRSFQMYALKGMAVKQVQKELGITDRNAVYQHKNRVLSMLRDEVQVLCADLGE